jgi:protein-serine/threonine kinase
MLAPYDLLLLPMLANQYRYECLVGWPPFASENPNDTYRKIVNWQQTLFFPDDVPLTHNSVHLMRR